MFVKSPSTVSALRQTEILTNILVPTIEAKSNRTDLKITGDPDLIARFIPVEYAIIVSQDCDLTYEFEARIDSAKEYKQMRQILLCELAAADKKVEWARQQGIYSATKEKNALVSNRLERFYFLPLIPKEYDLLEEGIGELIADFKLVYAVDPAFIFLQLQQQWNVSRRTMLDVPHKEHFTQRFYQYHARVGLPEQYTSI